MTLSNPKPENKFWLAFLTIVTIAVILTLVSCNGSKKAMKKDAQAVDRVLGSRTLIDKIKPAVLELYPCANDTFEIIVPGGIDSIPYPVTEIDTVIEISEGGYMQGFIDGQEAIMKRKIPIKRPDTIRVTVVDRQRQKADAETISQLRSNIANLDGKISEKDTAIAKANKWYWYFLIAVVLLVVSNVLWLYPNFLSNENSKTV